jgi:protease I
MKLDGIKVAVLVAPEFDDLEFYVPYMRLREEGANVLVAGVKAGETYQGKVGLTIKADASFDSLNVSELDAVIMPGGWAPDKLRRYEAVKKLVCDVYEAGKIVGMICHAGLVGISAGIVRGHDAIGSEGIKDDLINAGANWRNEAAFRSGNIVWGRVVADIPDYCRELVEALTDQKKKNQ